MRKKKPIFPWLGIVLVVIVAWVIISSSSQQSDSTTTFATLSVVSLEGVTRIFEGEIIEGMTVKDAITTSSHAGGFNFSYRYDENSGITHIVFDEIEMEITKDGKLDVLKSPIIIRLEINGKKVNLTEFDSKIVHGGDVIKISHLDLSHQ